MSAIAAMSSAAVSREQRTKPARRPAPTARPLKARESPAELQKLRHKRLASNMAAIARAALRDIAPGTQLSRATPDILAVIAEHVITDIGEQINRLGSAPGAKKTVGREALQIVLNRDSRNSILPQSMREEVVERALATMPKVAARLELKRAQRTPRRTIAE